MFLGARNREANSSNRYTRTIANHQLFQLGIVLLNGKIEEANCNMMCYTQVNVLVHVSIDRIFSMDKIHLRELKIL